MRNCVGGSAARTRELRPRRLAPASQGAEQGGDLPNLHASGSEVRRGANVRVRDDQLLQLLHEVIGGNLHVGRQPATVTSPCVPD